MSKTEIVKVKFLRTHPEFSYSIGESAEISREAFDRISKNGPFFEEAKAEKAASKEATEALEAPETTPETSAKAPTKGVKSRAHTR